MPRVAVVIRWDIGQQILVSIYKFFLSIYLELQIYVYFKMSSQGAERGDQTSASQQPSTRRSSGWKPRAEIMKRLSKLHCIPAILNFFSLIFSIINNADEFVPERDYKMDEAKEAELIM